MIPSSKNIENFQKEKEKENNLITLRNYFIESIIKDNDEMTLKIIMYIAVQIQKLEESDKEIIKFKIDGHKLSKATNISIQSLDRNILKVMKTTIAWWNGNRLEKATQLIPDIEPIVNTRIYVITMFSKIVDLFRKIKPYTPIDFNKLMKLKFKHSIRFLPILTKISRYGKEYAKTDELYIEEINMILGTNYKRYIDIEKNILSKLKNDLDNNSDISFIYHPLVKNKDNHTVGRKKYDAVKIHVIKN